jgi:hypothetical protein
VNGKTAFPLLALIVVALAMIAVDRGASDLGVVRAQSAAPTMSFAHLELPFFAAWAGSAHADITSRAFTNWNGADPPLVPTTCAKCHASAGFHDYLGLDGSAAGVVDAPAVPGVHQCTTCHNDVTIAKTTVVMPSGNVLGDLGREAVCMECHQGRQSGANVAAAITRAGVDHDQVMESQGFLNIHYYAAAATLYGSDAGGGFEYPGKRYEPRFAHVSEFQTCQSCHDPHGLQLNVASCATCHTGVASVADLRTIRMPGSFVDYDGDGDVTTGIYTELANLRAILFGMIQSYAREVVGRPIGYADANPYYYFDLDDDGVISASERTRANAYAAFTPRLLAAAYNYQVAKKDPGGYTHNAKYLIQIVYDSIEDLAGALPSRAVAGLVRPGDAPTYAPTPAAAAEAIVVAAAPGLDLHALRDGLAATPVVATSVLERLHRNDAGHFDASSQAWRNWDAAGSVPATCSTCHSAAGLPFFAQHGVQIAHAPAQGMACTTCHVAEGNFDVIGLASVRFPSGANLSFGTAADNLCAVCHQGRASTDTVNARIAAIPDDTISSALGFVNIHYFSAAASRFGGEARGGYQYAGKEYVGYWPHVEEAATCTQCHDPHTQKVDFAVCSDCHGGVGSVAEIRSYRMFDGDYDGDGSEGGTYGEIQHLIGMLSEAIRHYARETAGTPIVYSSLAHPYFFVDGNDDGVAQSEEVVRANQFASWTPRLLRAAYNYQYAKKDPGSYVHNGQYVIQLLHDSLEDLGWDTSGMHRPTNPF